MADDHCCCVPVEVNGQPVGNEECVTPFPYGGKLFARCTNDFYETYHWCKVFYWCTTNVIGNGTYDYHYVFQNVTNDAEQSPTTSQHYGVCTKECPRQNAIAPGNSTINPAMPEDARITTNLLKETQYNKTCYEWNSNIQENNAKAEHSDVKLHLATHPSYVYSQWKKYYDSRRSQWKFYPDSRRSNVGKCQHLCERQKRCLIFTYTPKTSVCIARNELEQLGKLNNSELEYPISAILGLKQCGSQGMQYMIQYTDFRREGCELEGNSKSKYRAILKKQSTVAIYTKNQSYGIEGGPVFYYWKVNHRCKLYWL